MRIVLVDSAPLTFGGGFERFLLGFSHHAVTEGHEVLLVEPKPYAADAISLMTTLRRPQRGLSSEDVRYLSGGGQRRQVGPHAFREIASTADVVYCKNEPQELVFVETATPKRLVIGFHSATEKSNGATAKIRNWIYRTPGYRLLLERADSFHLLSPGQSQLLKSFRLEHRPNAVIPNGVDTERFRPVERPSSQEFRVLFAGRLSPQKGIDLFCSAVKRILVMPMGTSIRFDVAGEGPLKSIVDQLTAISEQVNYLGYIPDTANLYGNYDLVVMPSRWETFGLVAAEALSCGTPVVLSDLPVLEQFQVASASRFFTGDEASLERTIIDQFLKWQETPEEYEDLRVMARQFALESLSGAARHQQLLDFLLSGTVGRRRAAL